MGLTRSKLKEKKQIRLVEMFVGEVTARTAADLVGVNYHTAHLFYQKLREIIAREIEDETQFCGEIEIDESYFGGVRKGKRGRGAAGKVAVFGILKRGGKVYTKVVPDTKTTTLLPVIQKKVKPDSLVFTDHYRSYQALDVSHFHHHRINHSTSFVQGKNHINGIENFWNQAKRILRKYNGIPKKSFPFFLKECEFRFNYGSPKQQLTLFKKWANLI